MLYTLLSVPIVGIMVTAFICMGIVFGLLRFALDYFRKYIRRMEIKSHIALFSENKGYSGLTVKVNKDGSVEYNAQLK